MTPEPEPTPAAAPTERSLSAALLRLRLRSPFLAALALFARYEVTDAVPTAATDGETVFVNPDFWHPLPAAEQDGLLLHEVLHCALGHCWRRAERDPELWNIAADIVINGMILAEPGAALPAGGLFDARLMHFGTEEVYELLERDPAAAPLLLMADLRDAPDQPGGANGPAAAARRQQQAGHWRGALQRAATVARSLGGDVPAALRRELAALGPGQLDWRSALWRYLVRTPTDFVGFDRRFVGQGLYLETLEGETVRVSVCIDTSGSVTGQQMARFAAEVQAILASYPHLTAELYFADAALYGPYPLLAHGPLPDAQGGGGTDFRPFCEALAARQTDPYGPPGVAIYLTDGYGSFPAHGPAVPLLWVVTAGGLGLDAFPFGEALRLGQ